MQFSKVEELRHTMQPPALSRAENLSPRNTSRRADRPLSTPNFHGGMLKRVAEAWLSTCTSKRMARPVIISPKLRA